MTPLGAATVIGRTELFQSSIGLFVIARGRYGGGLPLFIG